MRPAPRRLPALLVAAVFLACASPTPSSSGPLDWCAPVAWRPDGRFVSHDPCRPARSDADVARAAWVFVGGFRDVPAADAVSRGGGCSGPATHEQNADYAARVRALAPPGRAHAIRFIHAGRMELVSAGQAGLAGFDPDALLEPATPWHRVPRFFSDDASGACPATGCRWDFGRWDRPRRPQGTWLVDRIDERGGPGRRERVVYYIPKTGRNEDRFGPAAAIADLRNPAYRALRVADAKRAIALGGYDAVMLNHKLQQYRHGRRWLGSADIANVSALRRFGGSAWTARPKDYGYAEYVEGWTALAADLRAAGVPYAVKLQPHPWLTTGPERTRILEAVQGASFVLLLSDTPGPGRSMDEWRRLVSAEGAEVIVARVACGLGKDGQAAAGAEG